MRMIIECRGAPGLLSCRVKVFHIEHHLDCISPTGRQPRCPLCPVWRYSNCPNKSLIKHVKILPAVHVLKLITLPTNWRLPLKITIKSPKYCWAFFTTRRLMLLQWNRKSHKKSMKKTKLPGYMLSTVLETQHSVLLTSQSLVFAC